MRGERRKALAQSAFVQRHRVLRPEFFLRKRGKIPAAFSVLRTIKRAAGESSRWKAGGKRICCPSYIGAALLAGNTVSCRKEAQCSAEREHSVLPKGSTVFCRKEVQCPADRTTVPYRQGPQCPIERNAVSRRKELFCRRAVRCYNRSVTADI